MEERIVDKAEIPYPSDKVRYHFTRNGVSLRKLLGLLYKNKIDYRNLYAVHNKDARIK